MPPKSDWNYNPEPVPETTRETWRNRFYTPIQFYLLFLVIHLATNKFRLSVSFVITMTLILLRLKFNESAIAKVLDAWTWTVNAVIDASAYFLLFCACIYMTNEVILNQ